MIRRCGALLVACLASSPLCADASGATRTWVNGVELDPQGLLMLEAPLLGPSRIPGLALFMHAEREIVIEHAGSKATHLILRHRASPPLVRAQLDRSLVLAGWRAVAAPVSRDWRAAWFLRGEDLLGVHLVASGRGTRVFAGLLERIP